MHSYTGIVQHGGRRAEYLGFPTANIPLPDDSVSGIYAARVKFGAAEHIAVAFADQKRKLLEAHLLDFSGELKGKSITIELCEKIREHEDFTDDAALRAAIKNDIKEVHRIIQL